jgi:hypothetical protein
MNVTSIFSDFTTPSCAANYLAITGDQLKPRIGWLLSPRIMRWSENVLLIDLNPTINYWRQKSTEQGLSLEEFLTRLLPDGTQTVFADHPWKAVLHLKTFAKRGKGVFINLNAPLGKALEQDISWDHWYQTCEEYSLYLKTKGATLKQNMKKLMQTMKRMHIHSPAGFKDIEPMSMRRRFGVQLAQLWDWTWSTQHQNQINPPTFIWHHVKSKTKPMVQTVLLHPLREWAHIESLLRDDLDRICNLTCWDSSERVVSLDWVLSFSNSPTLTVPVLFRHPHSLHREITRHKTALIQAFYSWQTVLKQRLRSSSFHPGTNYLENDAVCEWKVVIRERIIPPTQMRSLFEDDYNSPVSRLRSLENNLKIKLESFAIKEDWTPDGSWDIETTNGETKETAPSADLKETLPSLLSQFSKRPLFIQKSPTLLDEKLDQSDLFQERVMTKWWENPERSLTNRESCVDYYLRSNASSNEFTKLQWVFSDHRGHLFLHGIYG